MMNLLKKSGGPRGRTKRCIMESYVQYSKGEDLTRKQLSKQLHITIHCA